MSATAIDLPPVNGLSEQQVRGTACVWCGVVLAPATAIDLGARPAQFAGSTANWFPRCCRRCNVTKAYNAVLDHINGCVACTADAVAGTDTKACEDGRGLRKAWQEARS